MKHKAVLSIQDKIQKTKVVPKKKGSDNLYAPELKSKSKRIQKKKNQKVDEQYYEKEIQKLAQRNEQDSSKEKCDA
jgi:hypothetical protein